MTIAARPPDWKRYLWHDGDVDFDSTSKASRSATVTIRSGGPRRDASLNPIVARVREELLRLAAEHGAAPKELDKAAPKKVSSLAFSTAAKATLRKGYTSAWASGITDSGLSFIDPQALAASGLTAWDLTDPQNIDPAQLDAAGITEADLADAFDNGEGDVTQATDNQSGFLDGLGALLAIGGLTAAAIDARMGLYSASLNPLYEQGFESGVGLQGTIAQATWHTSGDEGVCELCDSRDGESWQGDEEHPYPGEGGFGEVCEGGPNCRCELWYELIPASEADVAPGDTVDTSGDFVDGEVVTSADYAAAAIPDLTKYSPEQERVPAGGPGGGQFAGGAAPPDPEQLRAALKSWVGYRWDDGMNPPYVRDFHAQIRQALAGETVMHSSPYGPDVPAHAALAAASLQEGRALLAAIANAPVTSETLYRGLKMTDEQKDELVSRMKVGGKVDLNLSSWSTDIKAAGEYTGKGLGGRFSSPRVIMQLVGDKQALDVGATPLAWEKERLTDGRFTVLNVAERVNEQSPYRHSVDPSNPDAPPPMETVITLEQDSVFHDPVQTYGTKVGKVKLGDAHFDPWLEQFLDGTMRPTAAVKYSEDEPRDEGGRWTSDGGGGADRSFATTAEATKWLVDRWGPAAHGEPLKVDLGNADPKAASDVVHTLADLQDKYPGLASELWAVTSASTATMGMANGWMLFGNLQLSASVLEHPDLFAQQVAEDVRTGYTHKSALDNPIGYLTTHEFGHLWAGNQGTRSFWERQQQAEYDAVKAGEDKPISGYSVREPWEWSAEAFAICRLTSPGGAPGPAEAYRQWFDTHDGRPYDQWIDPATGKPFGKVEAVRNTCPMMTALDLAVARRASLAKYEGQPRDERGRFGEGKESDAAAPEAKPGLGEAQTRVSEQYTYDGEWGVSSDANFRSIVDRAYTDTGATRGTAPNSGDVLTMRTDRRGFFTGTPLGPDRTVIYRGPDGQPVGFITMHDREFNTPNHDVWPEVSEVVITPSARGQGLGTAMYDWVQDHTDINLYDAVGRSGSFTPEGKAFATGWLEHRVAVEQSRVGS